MNYEKFVSIIRKAKPSMKHTAQINVKVATDKEHTLQKIYLEKECRLCKQRVKTPVYVMFKKPVRLSIFQASLLYSLFIEIKNLRIMRVTINASLEKSSSTT